MRRDGFTLIELILVIAIVAILSVISFGSYVTSMSRGRDAQRKSDLATIRKGLEQYANDFGKYPNADVSGGIMACMDGGIYSCTTSLSYILNGSPVTVLSKLPTDPVSDRKYFYSSTGDKYQIYAALENANDKDKWNGGTALGMCGSIQCNYKVTNSGVETQ